MDTGKIRSLIKFGALISPVAYTMARPISTDAKVTAIIKSYSGTDFTAQTTKLSDATGWMPFIMVNLIEKGIELINSIDF